MEKIYDTLSKGENLSDAFKKILDKQKDHDLEYIKSTYKEGAEEEKVDQVYHEYEMNIDKLEYIDKLSNLGLDVQRRFSKEYLYIDSLDLDLGRKIETILSLGVIAFKNGKDIVSLSDEKLYLVSTLFTSIPAYTNKEDGPDQYDLYLPIFCDDTILEAVLNKSSNMNVRRDILRSLLEDCDYSVAKLMSIEEYRNFLKFSLYRIKNYKVPSETKENICLVA